MTNRTLFLVLALSLILLPIQWYSVPANASLGNRPKPIRVNRGKDLTIEERIAYQRRIEEVYWRHRTWPKENPHPKLLLDEVMPLTTIRAKTDDYLRKSVALEMYWGRAVTGDQLQAEMERMASQTKSPDLLKELWSALDNDPLVIAECLARPTLVERLIRNSYEEWRKEPFETWWKGAHDQTNALNEITEFNYRMPNIMAASSDCTDGAWTPTKVGVPGGRTGHTAVWTGTEMIVWGGAGGSVDSGGRYNPATDTWQATSTTNGPIPGSEHTAVWTGTEMIIWGGANQIVTGGRYNPTTDTWVATSIVNALPQNRHTAVWTGTEMIVWGGYNGSNYVKTGARYDPVADTWTLTSTVNAPSVRGFHTSIWTGSEMIVWGGFNGVSRLDTGGRYNPATDTWQGTTTTNAPSTRAQHTAVWTGTEMIIFGGWGPGYLNTGGRYNPTTDGWIATSTVNAPNERSEHTAVWTGSEMIVWGGRGDIIGYFGDGGRYNPSTDTWTAPSTLNSPPAGGGSSAVWTGSEMIIWGGIKSPPGVVYWDTGGRYNPSTDTWVPTNNTRVPTARQNHTAIWTGTEMIVWGGTSLGTGDRYDPALNVWTALSNVHAPSARQNHTAVWTGSEMIVWGGNNFSGGGQVNTGGRYNPATDTWDDAGTSIINAPNPRSEHTAVWNGTHMIIFGGLNGATRLNTGGRYDPSSDSWTATNSISAPAPRNGHTAVWTSSEMIVWGGNDGSANLSTGARYNPLSNSWVALTTNNAPTARLYHTAVWTGSEMIIWGGDLSTNLGGRYNPASDQWQATTANNAPSPRSKHTAVWTGSEMILWGGATAQPNSPVRTGGLYNPTTNAWRETSLSFAPVERWLHTAVWTGTEMIVFGGRDGRAELRTGGRYCICAFPLSSNTESFPASGGNGTVNINATSDCHWTATSNASWILIQSGSSGTGPGEVDYSVATNSGPYRTGTITIGGNIFTVTQLGANATDFCGTYDPAGGVFYLRNSHSSGPPDNSFTFGPPGGIAVVGDWDGDGIDTIGVYKDGYWFLRNSNTQGFADIVIQYGAPGYQPIVGDWDGDGVDTIGFFIAGGFYLRNSNTSGPPEIVFAYGISRDIALAGDWDGDGVDTVGVFDPEGGAFFLTNSQASPSPHYSFTYGPPGAKPVLGDWNADGRSTAGVYVSNTFFLRNTNNVGFADVSFNFSTAGFQPIAGHWVN